MAGPSKNSRASRSSTQNRPQNVGAFRVLTPVGGGTGAYVFNAATGANPRLAVDSDAFVDAVKVIAEAGHGAKVATELDELAAAHPGHGWVATKARLVEAGVIEA